MSSSSTVRLSNWTYPCLRKGGQQQQHDDDQMPAMAIASATRARRVRRHQPRTKKTASTLQQQSAAPDGEIATSASAADSVIFINDDLRCTTELCTVMRLDNPVSNRSPITANQQSMDPRAKGALDQHQHPASQTVSESQLWRRRHRRDAAATTTSPTRPKLTWAPLSRSALLLLSLLLVTLTLGPVTARHYIAPGPCTWTHVSPFISRDIRLKSATSHHHHHLSGPGSSAAAATADLLPGTVPSDFDVSLRCSVSSLTPYTLNLSLIEPEHTVKLAIGCFGGDLNSGDRSTLRPEHYHRGLATPAGSSLAPFEHLRFLNSLSIDSCKLDLLPVDAFRGLVSLKNLTIRNAMFSQTEPLSIEAATFRHVEGHLEHLDLGLNSISRLPTDLFCPFVSLRTLNLTGNALPDLSSFGLIDPATGRLCLQELQHLDLSHNRLEVLPENSGVAALRHLQVLNASYNQISEIAELAFSALHQLNVLDLSGNRLRQLPGRLFRDSEMTELHLANNGLAQLPAGIFKLLSKLLVLNLAGNQITSETLTKDTFADLIRLVVLDLSGNRLRHISATTFQSQYSLQVLALEGNDLETVEDGAFTTLYNLHTLKLARNRFRHLSDSGLAGLFVLHQLSLAENQLEHIHEEAFKNCSNLQNLDLSNNRLVTIPSALKAVRSLRQLNLSTNKLVTLTEPGPLVHTNALTSLDLSSNYLVNVTRAAFRPMANSLTELRLDGNRLRTLEKNTFEDLRGSLRTLRLDRNEFSDISSALAHVKALDRLESLNVSHNTITWFDYSVIPSGLRYLDLSYNRIEMLRNYYELEAKLALEHLDVSHNQIRSIAATSIPHSIRTLNLASNSIEKVDSGAFIAKHNVTFVDLRNNTLRRIDNTAFKLGVQRPTSSYFLNHHQSELNSSPAHFDAQFLPPPIFLIAGNPYYCDCTMEWLQRVNQLVGGVTGSGAISTYPRIGDLEAVTCELPFTRQADASAAAAAAAAVDDPLAVKATPLRVPLLQANSSNFLCRYRTHCFTVCHCCDFDACDCEMMCPENCTCYYDQTWNTNIVDCSAANYRNVPPRIPMDVTSLYLDGNTLVTLNAHIFIGRKNLRVLHLNHSAVESIANRSFNGLVYLEELHLEHNRLSALHGFEFEGLHYLTTLHLEYNQLTFIHEKTFSSLRSLQLLRLDHNAITIFGHWFSPVGLFASDLASSSSSNSPSVHHSRQHLTASLSANPWACDSCGSMAMLYDTLRVVASQLHIADAYEVRCLQANQSAVHLLRNLKDIEGSILERCNLTASVLPTATPSGETPPNRIAAESSPYHPASTEASYNIYKGHYIPPPKPEEGRELPPYGNKANSNGLDQEATAPAQDIEYHHVDKVTKIGGSGLPSSERYPPEMTEGLDRSRVDLDGEGQQSSSKAAPSESAGSFFTWLSGNLLFSLSLLACLIIISGLAFFGFKRKQDIQLWFYGHYGVRLFEAGGFCGLCRGGSDARARRNGAFTDHYVKDSEKLFDAFVIYARPDEQFVAQQLAAELECGFPPYRLCLRYRDLLAPPPESSTTTAPTKDNGHAFEAVTHAIECSRRTLVVISEAFLKSEWCKFELKAAHQETLTSRKTHRLIAVVVPSATPATYHHAQQPVAKLAEMLLARLDNELKACIRGVTVLTWGERRFWEKLRFSMPPSAAAPVCSGEGAKGRTSTVVVTTSTGSGAYPTLAPSSLSSSSSLARSSVLYDTSQPIYYPNHHYHYAQLPPPSSTANSSLHKSSSLSIFKQAAHHQSTTLVPPSSGPNATHLGTLRNPFNSKPLPPPPNQPLPPLPLVNSHFSPQQIALGGGAPHHQQSQQHESMPPMYATCSEFGGEYETTVDSSLGHNINNNNHLGGSSTLHGRSRAGLAGHPQFYHSSRRAPL